MTLNFGNQLFPQRGEILTNYNYTDIADGTGIIKFYAGIGQDDSGELAILNQNIFEPYLEDAETNGQCTRADVDSLTYVSIISKTFELTAFNKPQIIKGKLLCQIPYVSYVVGTDNDITSYAVVTVYKDAESIATETSASQAATKDTNNNGMYCLNVTVPQTSYKVGEQLKIKVEIYAKYIDFAGAYMLCHYPAGSTISAIDGGGTSQEKLTRTSDTEMVFFIPFKINI